MDNFKQRVSCRHCNHNNQNEPCVNRVWFIIAAFLGFSAVVLGAIGSHALKLGDAEHTWELATRYQMIHALLMLFFAQRKQVLGSCFIIAGCLLFCGGIYLKTLTGNAFWTGLAPVGGISFMLAWISVAFIHSR